MSNPLAQLNAINDAAYLAGLFNWQMNNATYTNPNGSKISFMVINNQGAPIEQFIQGAINGFNLVTGASAGDANLGLFNTSLSTLNLDEEFTRKFVLNRVPFANYDQPVDLGWGTQRQNFVVIFAGTMYQTALLNFIQVITNNDVAGLGTLLHPFYQTINNVLPINCRTRYKSDSLNCVICEITFLTSDLTHLNPLNITTSIVSTISKWYIGIQNSVSSIGGTIAAGRALSNNFGAFL